jgi:MFS family permease
MSTGKDAGTTSVSAWRPLRLRLFRNLLIADLVSDIGTFMQSVGAAWLMTSLSSNPMHIALIQTASALPFFILALPAGSIGDIVDRRKLILRTEVWMLVVAIVLAVATLAHWITPWHLLLLTFALSVGDAIEAPTWRAILPELVSKEDLSPALALNGIEFNLARAVGPALAGVLIAAVGVGIAFVLNAVSFLGVILVIARWKPHSSRSKLPSETFAGATSAALRYVRYSPAVRVLLLRAAFVIFFSSSFWALLPTVAKSLSGGSLAYGLLLGFFGIGAILGAIVLQRVRKACSIEGIVSAATAVFAVVLSATAMVQHLWILCIFLCLGGAAWTIFMSVFNTLVQHLAPDWVRARVLSVYLLVFQGSVAIGSAIWGFAAGRSSPQSALLVSSAGIAGCLLLRFRFRLSDPGTALDVWNHWGRPLLFAEPAPDQGPVLVTVEYRVDLDRAAEFLDAIHAYQRIRRRDGATRWGVFYDAEKPGKYIETFVVESWAEHQRQHDRFTVADRMLENQVLGYTLEPTQVRHFIYARKVKHRP